MTGDNAGVSNTFATAGSYPDVIGDPRKGVSSSPLPANRSVLDHFFITPDVFVQPTGLTFGDAGRNILRNPWRTNFDMAAIKRFAITESKYFEFRAEAFNVFNHNEPTYIGGDSGSAANNSGKNSGNTIACYGGADNSAGDPAACAGQSYFRSSSSHLPRILQLGAKFIF